MYSIEWLKFVPHTPPFYFITKYQSSDIVTVIRVEFPVPCCMTLLEKSMVDEPGR